jgi:hypothetical protein
MPFRQDDASVVKLIATSAQRSSKGQAMNRTSLKQRIVFATLAGLAATGTAMLAVFVPVQLGGSASAAHGAAIVTTVSAQS